MALLLKYGFKKLKASTLVEVLVASVIIVIIFSIASLTLNTVFKSTIVNNTTAVETELNKLQYLYQHKKISHNYLDNLDNWELSISEQKEHKVVLKARNIKTKKEVLKTFINEPIK